MAELRYRRILLKITGESLSGAGATGLARDEIDKVVGELVDVASLGGQVAVVVGAGNLIRGANLSGATGIDRATADQMGMLATVINALALRDVLIAKGCPAVVQSAFAVGVVCEAYSRQRAIEELERGRVVILAGGTGNPFCTTDTGASLRAGEIKADVIVKATKVDGVYSDDPMTNPDAVRYDQLTFEQVLADDLKVMDRAAMTMCLENEIDIVVCSLMESGTVRRVLLGEPVGTRITTK